MLVLGGTHADAVAARTRVVDLGGSAAVNLSCSVTDVLVLAGGEYDRRRRRIADLGLPLHDEHWLIAPTAAADRAGGVEDGESPTMSPPPAPHVLPRGGVIDLPAPPPGTPAPPWHITASWAPQDTCEIDLASLPPASRKVVIAAAIDGHVTFGDVGAVQVATAADESATALARTTMDAATSERALLLAEIYRRGSVWRFRAVGQGYDHGLADLARGYGVDITG
ncbi:TerD family protein [Streptomyces sp. NPDC093510]|uniref:TerD family protein n=1 Tax=Streptomyces sp. NPDC093510 TaxID=3155199 RepID=UPI00341E721F